MPLDDSEGVLRRILYDSLVPDGCNVDAKPVALSVRCEGVSVQSDCREAFSRSEDGYVQLMFSRERGCGSVRLIGGVPGRVVAPGRES